ncbi:putative pentatricopeptide repeat-containing protein At5g08310, mitochondrial [Typha angustifolia]|uniref:putative pentatricopeptide repeat-containing protein At5g08310, mitochondrial n=1 Tax=Typha angustifolia TaxID=59011 RepID=UPI003C3096F6
MHLRALRMTTLFSVPRKFHCNPNLHYISSPFDSSLSMNRHAHQLFDVFSKPSHLRDNEELRHLGRCLTPETVETVLKGLRSWRVAHEFFRWASWQPGFHHSCYTYNAMAQILSRTRQIAHLKNLASEVVSRRCPMTPGALGFLIRCLGSLNLVEEAEFVFDHAGEMNCIPNSYTYNCLLEVLGKAGQVESVETRFQEMVAESRREPDKYTLTAVLQCYCNRGMLEDVLQTINRMNERGWVDEHVMTILVVAFCKWGKAESACELIERMMDLRMRPSGKTLIRLVNGFASQGRVVKAVEMFDKMKDSGFVGDLMLYSALIERLFEENESKLALDLYLEMKENNISPNVPLLRTMISAFCREKDFAGVSQLLDENREKLNSGELVTLYNAILDGLINQGDIDRAYNLLSVMIEPVDSEVSEVAFDEQETRENEDTWKKLVNMSRAVTPDSDSFNIVICGLCTTKKLDMALGLLNCMVRLGCRGKLLMHNNLIHELCNVDRLDDAYELFSRMKGLGLLPTEFTYNSIFYGLCRKIDSVTSLDLLREMRIEGHVPWIKHCTMMVQQLCRTGEVAKASGFLSDMLKIGFLPDMVAYSAAIDGMCKNGEVDNALALFRDLSSSYFLPDVVAHNILINGFCKSGRLTEAQDIFEEILEKGLIPSVVTYNLMIDGWCKADKIEKALAYFKKMTNEERPPTVITYTSLIHGLCSAGRAEDALVLWREMRDNGCAPNEISYTALIHGLCKCSMADLALVYYHEMTDKGIELDMFVQLLLINSLILKGNTAEAFERLKEAAQNKNYHSADPKMYQLMKKAVRKLYEDEYTSFDTRILIERGCLPMIHSIHDIMEDMRK